MGLLKRRARAPRAGRARDKRDCGRMHGARKDTVAAAGYFHYCREEKAQSLSTLRDFGDVLSSLCLCIIRLSFIEL